MVVWEDRGVLLKPPKPPIVHATGFSDRNRAETLSHKSIALYDMDS